MAINRTNYSQFQAAVYAWRQNIEVDHFSVKDAVEVLKAARVITEVASKPVDPSELSLAQAIIDGRKIDGRQPDSAQQHWAQGVADHAVFRDIVQKKGKLPLPLELARIRDVFE